MFAHWPQVCRVKITFELLQTNWFVSTQGDKPGFEAIGGPNINCPVTHSQHLAIFWHFCGKLIQMFQSKNNVDFVRNRSTLNQLSSTNNSLFFLSTGEVTSFRRAMGRHVQAGSWRGQ